jgi:hypothetical protein
VGQPLPLRRHPTGAPAQPLKLQQRRFYRKSTTEAMQEAAVDCERGRAAQVRAPMHIHRSTRKGLGVWPTASNGMRAVSKCPCGEVVRLVCVRRALIKEHGPRDWLLISQGMQGLRNGKQCHQRYSRPEARLLLLFCAS